MNDVDKLRGALAKIADLASAVVKGGLGEGNASDNGHAGGPGVDMPGCAVKSLPRRLVLNAARTAMRINPVNAPQSAPVGAGADFKIMNPLQIAVLTSKYWGPSPRRLTVSFMESTPDDLRARILSHMNAWTQTACISFVETSETGDVRISRAGAGYWSYLGTDILHIPKNRPTMNLQGFTMSTPESEYHRVVRHETGHTLGFPHEHMRKELVARIDPQAAYRYFLATQGWVKDVVDAQVLTPLDDASIMGTPPDQESIMCYQLPASITKDHLPIIGGIDINATDFEFAGRIYPKAGSVTAAALRGLSEENWPESEDVETGV
jgi:hypothetical protein